MKKIKRIVNKKENWLGSLFRKKFFILIIVTLILFIIIGISSSGQNGFKSVSNIISVPFKPVMKLFDNISNSVSGFFNHFGDIKKLKDENKELKSRIQKMDNENKQILLYKEENSELRKALGLIDFFNDSDVIGANIIAKNTDNWFDVFSVDVGSNSGVTINTPVVNSANTLVGRVKESDLLSSKIVTITDPESRISGMVLKKGAGLLKITGDYEVGKKGYCIIEDIADEINIEPGDIVQTSGMGGIYPKGIAIGLVESVYKKQGEIHREALLKVFTDFKEIDKVFLIIPKGSNNEKEK